MSDKDKQQQQEQQWFCGLCDAPTKKGERLCSRCKKVAKRL